MKTFNIYNENCLETMARMEDNSIDAIVTDPPYGLSFMGKKWDYDVPSVKIWKECLRVLKHGGHLLAFAGTRTQHRMAVNIEDAGFEIRDMLAWIYGSGFPKSLNIGKAIDKSLKVEPKTVGTYVKKAGDMTSGNFKRGENYPDKVIQITEPTSKEAQQWQGWGTALKPALEPITLARKPLSEKTIAANILKWGTGGINIDGCRVGDEIRTNKGMSAKKPDGAGTFRDDNWIPKEVENTVTGRFPANLIHDGSQLVLDLFPQQKSGAMKKPYKYQNNGSSLGTPSGVTKQIHNSSSGTAARFFYCAKASKSERNTGLDDFQEKPKIFNGQSGVSSTAMKGVEIKFTTKPQKNNHPTVKPIKLMCYLVRLITPPNGTVYDPFTGSGSTGVATIKEGFYFLGSEIDKNSTEISNARCQYETNKK